MLWRRIPELVVSPAIIPTLWRCIRGKVMSHLVSIQLNHMIRALHGFPLLVLVGLMVQGCMGGDKQVTVIPYRLIFVASKPLGTVGSANGNSGSLSCNAPSQSELPLPQEIVSLCMPPGEASTCSDSLFLPDVFFVRVDMPSVVDAVEVILTSGFNKRLAEIFGIRNTTRQKAVDNRKIALKNQRTPLSMVQVKGANEKYVKDNLEKYLKEARAAGKIVLTSTKAVTPDSIATLLCGREGPAEVVIIYGDTSHLSGNEGSQGELSVEELQPDSVRIQLSSGKMTPGEVVISGKTSLPATLEFALLDVHGSETTGADGRFSHALKLPQDLTVGTHPIYVVAKAGTQEISKSIKLTVENPPPHPSLVFQDLQPSAVTVRLQPSPDRSLPGEVVISGKTSVPANLEFTLLGVHESRAAGADGQFSHTLKLPQDLTVGTYQISVVAKVGTQEASKSIKLTVENPPPPPDGVPPVPPFPSPCSGPYLASFQSAGEAIRSYQYANAIPLLETIPQGAEGQCYLAARWNIVIACVGLQSLESADRALVELNTILDLGSASPYISFYQGIAHFQKARSISIDDPADAEGEYKAADRMIDIANTQRPLFSSRRIPGVAFPSVEDCVTLLAFYKGSANFFLYQIARELNYEERVQRQYRTIARSELGNYVREGASPNFTTEAQRRLQDLQ